MEIKVIIEPSEKLIALVQLLTETSQTPKTQPEIIVSKAAEEVVKKQRVKVVEKTQEVETLSAEQYREKIKQLGANKKAEGKDVKAIINKYAAKLAQVKDEDLKVLFEEVEAL